MRVCWSTLETLRRLIRTERWCRSGLTMARLFSCGLTIRHARPRALPCPMADQVSASPPCQWPRYLGCGTVGFCVAPNDQLGPAEPAPIIGYLVDRALRRAMLTKAAELLIMSAFST